MKKFLYIVSLFPILPTIALAQTLSAQSLIGSFLSFSNRVLIPFLFAIAFVFFLINVVRFFIIGGSNEEGQKNAKNLAVYSVLAFVLITIFWGIVNLLASTVTGCSSLDREFDAEFGGPCTEVPISDYIENNDSDANSTAPSRTAPLITPDYSSPQGQPQGQGGTTNNPPARQPIDENFLDGI